MNYKHPYGLPAPSLAGVPTTAREGGKELPLFAKWGTGVESLGLRGSLAARRHSNESERPWGEIAIHKPRSPRDIHS